MRDDGAVPVAVAALLSLGQASARVPVPYYAVGTIPSQVWPAGQCPLGASGVALRDPA